MYENFILKKGLGLKSQDEIMKMFEESRALAKALNIKPYYMYRQKNMVGNMENLGYAKPGKECLYNIEMIEDKQTIICTDAAMCTDEIKQFNIKDGRAFVITQSIKKLKQTRIFIKKDIKKRLMQSFF